MTPLMKRLVSAHFALMVMGLFVGIAVLVLVAMNGPSAP